MGDEEKQTSGRQGLGSRDLFLFLFFKWETIVKGNGLSFAGNKSSRIR